MKELTDAEKSFAEWLKEFHEGERQAVTSREMRHWGKGTEIRRMVHNLRVHGIPVCSTESGYYYSENAADVQRSMNSLRSRYLSIMAAYEGLNQFMQKAEIDIST